MIDSLSTVKTLLTFCKSHKNEDVGAALLSLEGAMHQVWVLENLLNMLSVSPTVLKISYQLN